VWEATGKNAGGQNMSDKNKALAARIPLEAFNQGKLEVIDEVIADNSIDHGELPPGMPAGKEGRWSRRSEALFQISRSRSVFRLPKVTWWYSMPLAPAR
jgi:hypothetical protein